MSWYPLPTGRNDLVDSESEGVPLQTLRDLIYTVEVLLGLVSNPPLSSDRLQKSRGSRPGPSQEPMGVVSLDGVHYLPYGDRRLSGDRLR